VWLSPLSLSLIRVEKTFREGKPYGEEEDED
jgi:hypothetical protein